MTRRVTSWRALAALSLATPAVTLALCDLSWNTIDGGGGMFTTGGTLELSGTIGQADAGAMSGSRYSLNGGFWPVATAGEPGCNGNERIAKTPCKERNGANLL